MVFQLFSLTVSSPDLWESAHVLWTAELFWFRSRLEAALLDSQGFSCLNEKQSCGSSLSIKAAQGRPRVAPCGPMWPRQANFILKAPFEPIPQQIVRRTSRGDGDVYASLPVYKHSNQTAQQARFHPHRCSGKSSWMVLLGVCSTVCFLHQVSDGAARCGVWLLGTFEKNDMKLNAVREKGRMVQNSSLRKH